VEAAAETYALTASDICAPMTTDILLLTLIFCFALSSFIRGQLRVDVTALAVLCCLAVTGLVSPQEAVAAFGNPAVVTIWAMYILSAALVKTDIANMLGSRVLKFSGRGETGLIVAIMSVSGLLSAFMNNIGVAALMLPVIMSISRITHHPPSRLLIPMAFGVLLGGFTTMLSTINILTSNALREYGLTPFGLFDFTPVGICVLSAGIFFMALFGRRFLPRRDLVQETLTTGKNLQDQYELQARMNALRVPPGCLLTGKSIADISMGALTGLTVVAILRNNQTILAPDPASRLTAGDVIIIEGRLDRLNEFRGWQKLQIEQAPGVFDSGFPAGIQYAGVTIADKSPLIGKTYYEVHFRKNYGINVVAIQQGGLLKRSRLASHVLQGGDELIVRGCREALQRLGESADFTGCARMTREEVARRYTLQEQLFVVRIAEDSSLVGKNLSKSRMGAVFGLHVVALMRGSATLTMPGQDEIIQRNDRLVIGCRKEDFDLLRGLQELQIESEPASRIADLESEQVGLIEAVLSPRSNVAGKTLRDLHFRAKYGLQVIAIWREGKAIRTNMRDIELRFGDALLLMGNREHVRRLKDDGDFILLSQPVHPVVHKRKAPLSAGIMAGFVAVVFFGWLPISTAALAAAVLMILSGCLSIDEAYKAIDWKSIFLIAGMMPLGIAIQKTGAAGLIAAQIPALHAGVGPWGILVLLYLLMTAAGAFIPTSALVVCMSPLFLTIAGQIDISPYAVMMVLAVSASASFISPVSHPANVLVMGPGGYRFADYIRVGLPLSLVVMIVGLLMIAVVWPL
jgi:di/tricarboxylate transporter